MTVDTLSRKMFKTWIDRAVERDGPTYVRENIDRLLAGINVVMTIDKAALEVPTATDAAVNRWEPSTSVDPTVARAQTRRAAERTPLVDSFVDPSLLDDRPVPMLGVQPSKRLCSINEEAASSKRHRHLVVRECRVERR